MLVGVDKCIVHVSLLHISDSSKSFIRERDFTVSYRSSCARIVPSESWYVGDYGNGGNLEARV
jgi:hypothetical protein